jgi:hypothetical protein
LKPNRSTPFFDAIPISITTIDFAIHDTRWPAIKTQQNSQVLVIEILGGVHLP